VVFGLSQDVLSVYNRDSLRTTDTRPFSVRSRMGPPAGPIRSIGAGVRSAPAQPGERPG